MFYARSTGYRPGEPATDRGGVWDTTMPGDQNPGSWGGHCLLAWDYDGVEAESVVSLLTWGGISGRHGVGCGRGSWNAMGWRGGN